MDITHCICTHAHEKHGVTTVLTLGLVCVSYNHGGRVLSALSEAERGGDRSKAKAKD